MNVALVNPIAATPSYGPRDFMIPPKLPDLTSNPRSLGETNLIELGAELSRCGHDVTVLFGDGYVSGQERTLARRLRVAPLPMRFRIPFHPGLVPVTPELIRHPALQGADVVQVSEFHQPSTFFACLGARERSVPVVVWQETFRRMRFPGSLYQRAFESTVGGCVRDMGRRFIPRTTHARNFLSGLGVDEHRITRWIPTGIDTSVYRPARTHCSRQALGWPEDSRVLFLAARLIQSKGVDFALRTLKWVRRRRSDVRLVIGGSGPELERLRQLVAELDLAREALFLGRLSRDQMVDFYNLADVVLCTSETDLLPFTLIEASACGKPCIVADVGAIRDIVVDCVTGIVVPNRSVEAFGAAILSVLGDDERRLAFGGAARARAELHFALSAVAKHLTEVYQGVAG